MNEISNVHITLWHVCIPTVTRQMQ